ncbi:hypothetical protein C8J57DRAFT_1306880 [Mycena rebaudengoi]|nr:hypothetical protein C8J57DRAFT_1306880 [Mycena rebaudengoi]
MDHTQMWLSCILPFVMRMTCPGAICADALVPEMPYMDGFLEARDQMMECAAQSVCMRIGCNAPPATAVLTKLYRRCEVVRYCSKDCQRLAWRSEKSPHKQVCDMISLIRQPLLCLYPIRSQIKSWTSLIRPGSPGLRNTSFEPLVSALKLVVVFG